MFSFRLRDQLLQLTYFYFKLVSYSGSIENKQEKGKQDSDIVSEQYNYEVT